MKTMYAIAKNNRAFQVPFRTDRFFQPAVMLPEIISGGFFMSIKP